MAGLFWPPVIAVALLSSNSTVTLACWYVRLSRPCMPECRKVESPITATTGRGAASVCCALAMPLTMPSDAPIASTVSTELHGGLAPSV